MRKGPPRWWLLMLVLYLLSAGWAFVLLPWSSFWASRLLPALPPTCAQLFAHPALKGALSGFGLLHFFAAWDWLSHPERPP